MKNPMKALALLVWGVCLAAALGAAAQGGGACPVVLSTDPDEPAGVVVSVGSSSFVLNVNGTNTTINVNASTLYVGVSGLTGLAAGDLVRADVTVQPDTSLLASEVELLFDASAGGSVNGRIACVDPNTGAATSVRMVFAPATPDHAFPPVTIQVNVLGNTKFKVNKGNINTTGFTFDASNLTVGQRLTAVGNTFTGDTEVQLDARQLMLKLEEVEGTVVDGTVDTGAGTFQLTVTSPSGQVMTTPVLVRTDSRTSFVGQLNGLGDLNATDTYQVRGLVMRNPAGADAGAAELLAKRIKKRPGGGPPILATP